MADVENDFDNQGSITGPVVMGRDHIDVTQNVEVKLSPQAAKAVFQNSGGVFGSATPAAHGPHDHHAHHHWPGDHTSTAGGLLDHMQHNDGNDGSDGGLFG